MKYYSPHDVVPQGSTFDDHHAPEMVQSALSGPNDTSVQPSLQPGLEVALASWNDKYSISNMDESDKEVVREEVQEVVLSDKLSYALLTQSDWRESDPKKPARSRRICGMTRRIFWSLLVAVLFAIALAVGLGVGLTSKQSNEASSPPSTFDTTSSSTLEPSATPTASKILEIGGSVDSSYYTTSGAWNGSGIAYIWQNFTQDWDDILSSNEYSHVVYFQHHTGEIQWMRQTSDYSWKQGPQDLLVVATDARNSTPISAVQHTANGVNYWNVFYIDSDNFIRQRSGNNQSAGWTEGSISKAELTAYNGDLIGLSACESAINASIPIRLFYASNSTAYEEYLWWAEEDDWVWQQTWEGYSAAADVGCTGVGDYRYLGVLNPNNRVEIWYQPAADIFAKWQKAQYEIHNVHPASSLIFTPNYAVYQENSTNAIRVATVKWDNFYTRNDVDGIGSPADGLSGIPGTHMDAKQNGDYTWIFYQRNGEDVTWLERALTTDKWQVKSPIPFP